MRDRKGNKNFLGFLMAEDAVNTGLLPLIQEGGVGAKQDLGVQGGYWKESWSQTAMKTAMKRVLRIPGAKGPILATNFSFLFCG